MVKEIGIIELTPEIFLNDFKALLELSNEKIELLADITELKMIKQLDN